MNKKTLATLEKAIRQLGGLNSAARAIGESPQALNNWRRRGVPVNKAVKIERATAGTVTRVHLHPDHFGDIYLRGRCRHGGRQ